VVFEDDELLEDGTWGMKNEESRSQDLGGRAGTEPKSFWTWAKLPKLTLDSQIMFLFLKKKNASSFLTYFLYLFQIMYYFSSTLLEKKIKKTYLNFFKIWFI
jgi:hypothetical protein